MALDRAWSRVESFRDVVGLESRRVEPLFECLGLSGMPERRAVPHAKQRRDLVEARATSRLQRRRRSVPTERSRMSSVLRVRRRAESSGKRQLVVGI